MEVKINLKLFIFIIVVILLLVAGTWVYLIVNNSNNNVPTNAQAQEENNQNVNTQSTNNEITQSSVNNNITTTNNTITQLDINSELVQKLYNYTKMNVSYSNMNGKTVESIYNSKTIINDLSDDWKILVALTNMKANNEYTVILRESLPEMSEIELSAKEKKEGYVIPKNRYIEINGEKYIPEEDVLTFDIETIKTRINKMFNTDINIVQNEYVSMFEEMYIKEGDKYFNLTPASLGRGGIEAYVGNTRLIKAEQQGEYIYLYDNYLYMEMNSLSDDFDCIYATFDKTIKLTSILDSFGDESSITPNDIYDYDYIDGTLVSNASEILKMPLPIYKHTYKKNIDGSYYWVSTELNNQAELITIV